MKVKYVSRDQVLGALIAYGWIDGRRKDLDDRRTIQLIAPRQTDDWTQTYRTRAARLGAEGRMQPFGADTIARATAASTWVALPDVDALQVPGDRQAALEVSAGADWFAAAAPSYRRKCCAGSQRPRPRPSAPSGSRRSPNTPDGA